MLSEKSAAARSSLLGIAKPVAPEDSDLPQDFYAAFGLGLGGKTIDTIDPDGVALAAIQGLNTLVKDNEERLAEKDAEIAELLSASEDLRQRLERLEGLVTASAR